MTRPPRRSYVATHSVAVLSIICGTCIGTRELPMGQLLVTEGDSINIEAQIEK